MCILCTVFPNPLKVKTYSYRLRYLAFGVVSVVPLDVGHVALLCVGDIAQLFPQCSHRVLILGLFENYPLNELI